MKVRFSDIYTGEVYSLAVSEDKLVLSKISTREAAEKFYVIVDQVTGITYILQVAQGKLQIVRPSKSVFGTTLWGVPDAEGTRVYVIELLGGKLFYREASAEEISKMTSDESSIFMNRRLQDYLPLFIQEYEEIQTIMNAQEQTVIQNWKALENVLNDQFVSDATENGIKRWEVILKLTPKDTYTLEERRFHVLARLSEQPVFTMETLRTALAGMCGENGYTVSMNHEKYILSVKLSLGNENKLEAVKLFLRRMVPANIEISISMFNTHVMVGNYTHEQLAAHTHKRIREENFV